MNFVILIGRFTKKPELEYTRGNTPVTRFIIAVDRGGDKGADFIKITAFDKQAENICRFMDKGRQIAILGKIQTGSYEKDGQTFYTQDVISVRSEFLGSNEQRNTEPRSTDRSYHNYGGYSEPPQDYRRYEETVEPRRKEPIF